MPHTETTTTPSSPQGGTLQSDLHSYTETLPDFSRFLAQKILSGEEITDADIDTSYSYLLEDWELKDKVIRPKLGKDNKKVENQEYEKDLTLTALKNVTGVNALAEGQSMEFTKNVTVIYGSNGSGKSGYIRLLKKAFFSRAEEDIKGNIYETGAPKKVGAEFVFSSEGSEILLQYPDKANNPEFNQFSVFDGKSVPIHLNGKNHFEFRPAGLDFFSNLIDATKDVESKLDEEIQRKGVSIDYGSIMPGQSEIKTVLESISAKTKIADIKKFLPYSDEDKERKRKVELKKARLMVLKPDKEIGKLQEIKNLLQSLKTNIESINKLCGSEAIVSVKSGIDDLIKKRAKAKKEGTDSFKSDDITNIGSPEWIAFIEAAQIFADQQEYDYPNDESSCLLCHQPLSNQATELINKYWQYLQSEAEKEAREAEERLKNYRKTYRALNFEVLSNDSVLYKWLETNGKDLLSLIETTVLKQKKLVSDIISDISGLKKEVRIPKRMALDEFSRVSAKIDQEIKSLTDSDPSKELAEIEKNITFLSHKEILSKHINGIEGYIKNLIWVEVSLGAKRALSTRKFTEKEKELSQKYFNQLYIDMFNTKCSKLNADFGIEITHTGSMGTSYRQLKLNQFLPGDVLSEGEQKVISIADFICEMSLSDDNKGIIFDDPVNSLDDERKADIARLLIEEGANKQVIVFTHDLMFVSQLMIFSKDSNIPIECHWIEKQNRQPGIIWLRNSPSYEKKYRNITNVEECYAKAKKAPPQEREQVIKDGFAALRTCYEAMVVFDLFNGVVQRFVERVSVDSLDKAIMSGELRDKILANFGECCRFMEGHSHSDKYAYKKPEITDLKSEMEKFTKLKSEIKEFRKALEKTTSI